MRARALGLVVLLIGSVATAYTPPAGFKKIPEKFQGDAFAVAPDGKVAVAVANFSGGATVKVYASAAAAQAATSPIRTFTDPTLKAFGDLTFVDSDTLIFSENGDNDTVYRGVVSSGAMTQLAATGSVPNAAGVAISGSTIYAVAGNNPGTGALYTVPLAGGSATAQITNAGTGYLGGVAIDPSGNVLITDTNDPTFAGNAGKLLRYTSSFAPLTSISLMTGGGSGAYDVILDSEGDAFVTTGATLTRIPAASTTAQQFGPAFTSFPFLTGLDFAGSGFEPNVGAGKLFINATFSEESGIIGITPLPEPGAALAVITIAAFFISRRLTHHACFAATAAITLAGFAMTTPPVRANENHYLATQVISRTIGANQQSGFTDPNLALGPPRGGGANAASTDTYCLGNGGSITLGFDTETSHRFITNGPGEDFDVFENSFFQNGDPTRAFAELMWVEVSTDGVNFARFNGYSATKSAVGPFGVLNPDDLSCFGGVMPTYANPLDPSTDAFNPDTAGGDALDLDWLSKDPKVTSGLVDLNWIRYVRLVDVIGDGSNLDGINRPIYDPTGFSIGGADVDAVAVINGAHMPEPSLGAIGLIAFSMRRTRH